MDAHAGKLEEAQASQRMFERSPEGDAGDARMPDHQCGERGRARGLGLDKGFQKKIDKRRHDDDERDSGEALVGDEGDTCVEHSRSLILRSRHESSRSSRDAIDVNGIGLERACSESFQRCRSDRIEEEVGKNLGLRYLWLQDMTKTVE